MGLCTPSRRNTRSKENNCFRRSAHKRRPNQFKHKSNHGLPTKNLNPSIATSSCNRRVERILLAIADSKPNAAAPAANMAPALTEPLSPTEKLSSSTPTTAPTTRSSRKAAADTVASTSASSSTSTREKRNNRSSLAGAAAAVPTASTRITRSKDAFQSVFESALNESRTPPPAAPSAAAATSQNTKPPERNDEQMGLSAALNNNNEADTAGSKDTSRAQLLADLTSDYEEAITADICLRKQLVGVNVEKAVASAETEEIAGDSKDILVIKSVTGTGGEAHPIQTPHMESKPTTTTPTEEVTKEKQQHLEETINKNESELEQQKPQRVAAATPEAPQTNRENAARLENMSVPQLPAIHTDSTMTASEPEDNLEERLSQLDGPSVLAPASKRQATAETTIVTPATPPRTPPPQQQHDQQQHLTPGSTSTISSMNLAQSFIKESGAGELEDQDIEEVLKALKGFDTNTASDTLGDLNSFFNDVYTFSCEEMGGGSSQPTVAVAAPTVAKCSASPLKEMQADVEKQHATMQRRIDSIVKRLRKLQARYMTRHTSEEISGLFEWCARATRKNARNTETTEQPEHELNISVTSSRPPVQHWNDDKKSAVTQAQVSAMVKQIGIAANAQQLSASATAAQQSPFAATAINWKKSKKSTDGGISTMSPTSERHKLLADTSVVPTFDPNTVEELTHVTGLLQTEMREVQNAIDSEATESSSGAESADEMIPYNNSLQLPLRIGKRAAWRFSRDRAAIASRWSWLLSQISDLEIKIRQHAELYQEVIRSKGGVVLATELAGAKASAETTTTTSVNGYKGDLSVTADAETEGGCSRTRGYVGSLFRKRKLFQTANIHTISKKAARQSTIKCGCQWPLIPCALCTGRVDPTAPRDLPDTMPMSERIALLDPGFHPVLSFRDDVTNSIHFEAIARQTEWQTRVMRCQVKSIAKSVWKAEREASSTSSHHHYHATTGRRHYDSAAAKRRYIKKKDRLRIEAKAAAAAATKATNTTNSGGGGLVGGDAGNGTGTLAASTTPLVANKEQQSKNTKSLHCHPVGDGVLLEPLTAPGTNNTNSSSYIHKTSDFPQRNCDRYNPNPAHSSLISSSSKNSKHRKHTTSASSANAPYLYNHHHNSQYFHSNGGGESSFLHTNDSWDCFTSRSRTSSPTHGGNLNYHKYERSFDRKNRNSYDIDNIVIPYSVAAATRVEILPYKEIPTPKWRVVDNENEIDKEVPCDSEEKKMPNAVNENSYNEVKSETAEKTSECVPATEKLNHEHSQFELKINVEMKDMSNKTIKREKCVKQAEDNNENELHNSVNDELNQLEDTSVHKTNEGKPTRNSKEEVIGNEVQVSDNAIETKRTRNSKDVVAEDEHCCASAKSNESNAETKIISIDDKRTAQAMLTNHCTKKAVVILQNCMLLSQEPPAKRLRLATAAASEVRGLASLSFASNKLNCSTESIDHGGLEEDISDDAMVQRHERALLEERRKFQLFMKFPWSTRSRANRRYDSRAESSGANTPDPASPAAPNTPNMAGCDQESIPSPLAPSTPLDSIGETVEHPLANASAAAPIPASIPAAKYNSKRYERRRTTSAKVLERRCSTPDPKEFIPPFEPLKFPLSDEEYNNMVRSMPRNFCDDNYFYEDSYGTGIKFTRSRSQLINDFAATKRTNTSSTATNCDVNTSGKEKTSQDFINDTAVGDEHHHRYENGGKEEEEDNEDDDMEEDDDDYPKHHLAPPDDFETDEDDDYNPYVGGGRDGLLGSSDCESNETDPFQDDDPNDPEWKRSVRERVGKHRRKL